MLTRRTVILAATETTYGTDPAMTGTNALLAFDVDIDIKGEVLKREVVRDTLSPLPHVIGLREAQITFKTELKGDGAAVVPEVDPLMIGCSFGTGVVVATTSITYNLVSNESVQRSVALKVYKDGNLHKIVGARGTVRFVLVAGQFGVAEWDFQGLYTAVIAATIPDISGMTVNKPPIVYNSSFQIGGYSPVTGELSIDLANTLARRDDLNAATGVNSFRITGREPKAEFSVDAVVEASNPYWGDLAGDVINTYSILVGKTTGNKIEFSGNHELETVKYSDSDGVSTYDVVAALVSSNPDTQDDELVVSFK